MLDPTKWEPADVIRLAALIGALLLAVVGSLMMWFGISADGAIDIKSTVISGSIKTASAGLFILFFAFAIIVYVLASLGALHRAKSPNLHSPSRGIGIAFLGALGACVATGTLKALGYGGDFGFMSFMLGALAVGIGVMYLASLEMR